MKPIQAPRWSISTTLLTITGMLTALAILFAATEIFSSARRLSDLRELRRTAQLSDQLFEATESLARERDFALSALAADDDDLRATLRERMMQSRGEAAPRLDAAVRALGQTSDGLADARTNIRGHDEALARLRAEIDQALEKPSRKRAGDLSARWSDEVGAVIADSENLWLDFIRPYARVNSGIMQQLRYNHFLLTIYDYSGRERSLVAQILAGGVNATGPQIADLHRGEGVIDLSWSTSAILARQAGFYPPIAPAYSDAKSHYDTIHGMLQDAFYAPGAEAQASLPIGADLWLELCDQYLDSLDALRTASRKVIAAQLEARIDECVTSIWWRALILAIALALGGLSFWIVRQRVIAPINDVVAALIGATRGEAVTFKREDTRDDEIGQLVEVLHAFQQQTETIRRGVASLDISERRLRAVVDNAVDGLITIDAHGTIQSFNPACERIFGYRPDEVLGRNISMLMPDPDRQRHDLYLAHYAGTGEARAIGAAGRELMAQRKDGTVFPIDLSISGITLPEGQCFAGIVRDISQRKQAERELVAHAQALERSNKELDDFAYIASHDLKEPLRGIHNHSRFLLEDNGEKLDEESVKRLNRLVFLSQRMEGLVNDLLYFSRLGRQELAIQATDLNAVVGDIEATLDQFLHERGARILIPLPLPTIICDRPRVTEAIRNLITNAVKYNDKDDKKIEIGFREHVRKANGDDRFDVYYVKDNGRGIAREFHQDIFRIFKRLQAGKGAEDGSGVGLTFVKKIIERHGGEIWLDSEPNVGTTFYFTLETPHAGSNLPAAEAA